MGHLMTRGIVVGTISGMYSYIYKDVPKNISEVYKYYVHYKYNFWRAIQLGFLG